MGRMLRYIFKGYENTCDVATRRVEVKPTWLVALQNGSQVALCGEMLREIIFLTSLERELFLGVAICFQVYFSISVVGADSESGGCETSR